MDLIGIRRHLAPYYGSTGRPSIDPKLVIRMLLVRYTMGIRAQADWEQQCEKISRDDAPRAVREYLATLDDAAFGAASPAKPKFTWDSDPASQWTGARDGPAEATRSIRQAAMAARYSRSGSV